MASTSRRLTDVLRGTVLPEGSITAELGSLYIYQPTSTSAIIYQKANQTVAGTPDNVGWVAVGQQQSAQLSAWFPPAVPNAFDEEFSTGTGLSADWEVSEGAIGASAVDPYAGFAGTDTRISHNILRPGWLMVQPPSTGAFFTITKRTAGLPTDYAVMTRSSYDHRMTAAVGNDFTHGLILSTHPFDTNNRIQLHLNESDAGVIQAEFSYLISGVATSIGVTANISPTDHTPFEGCWIQKKGSTYHGWVITNNGSSIYLGNTSAFTPTVGRMGFFFYNTSSSSPGNMIMGADFMRVIYTDKFHP